MYSVTQRIGMITQPRGGYLPKSHFTTTELNDAKTLNDTENILPIYVGSAVDYLTRWGMGTRLVDAFSTSLIGARCYDFYMNKNSHKKDIAKKNAKRLILEMQGFNDHSIINACKLTGYDRCYRDSGMETYKPVEEINPDKNTIENIKIMVERSLQFWKIYGPIVKDGFTLEGGYTDVISVGDGDFLSTDTLWDFKVLKSEPNSRHTLQLLVYYIMGMHSVHPEFQSIKKLGIFNPRLNKVYITDIASIDVEIIKEVSHKVIGYS